MKTRHPRTRPAPLLALPIHDCRGRRRKVVIGHHRGHVVLKFTGSHGHVTHCAVAPEDAFGLLAAANTYRRTTTVFDVDKRSRVWGFHGEIHVARRSTQGEAIALDATARDTLRAQIAGAVNAARDWPRMPKPTTTTAAAQAAPTAQTRLAGGA